jgi:hypothetical protein
LNDQHLASGAGSCAEESKDRTVKLFSEWILNDAATHAQSAAWHPA